MGQVPVKFRIVEIIYENKGISDEEILDILKNDYPFDRSVNEKCIEEYLLSLKGVGIIELIDAAIDDNDKFKMWYKITNYGINRMKYINGKKL